ncbi:Prp18 domain-containing protein [Scheffersomyces xylosifermentans]|uniref:Prp18 domain-containing protein n=1 Tax=Scheffersomyces xylosifermentans TaxID=1304137 RepID=UPI00315DD97F
MDFSSVLSNEINKKRKQALSSRKSLKKSKKRSGIKETESGKDHNSNVIEVEDVKSSVSGKEVSESDNIGLNSQPDDDSAASSTQKVAIDVPLKGQDDENEKVDDYDSRQNSRIRHSKEDSDLLNSISDDQLNQKLHEFNEWDKDPNLTRLEKIKKIQYLMRQKAKNEKYKDIIDKEAMATKDPAKKKINLDYITEIERNKDTLYIILRVCIKDLIRNWEDHINYSSSIDSSQENESETRTNKRLLHETKRDLVKLLYKLRSQKLSDDMLTSLTTIIYHIQNHEFRKANESYMKLSIGNVAWPIGVQNVGIHARSAASKITGVNKAANIMIDDKTRRWITGIKRIITASEKICEKERS